MFSSTVSDKSEARSPTDETEVKYYNVERDEYNETSYYDLEEDMKKLRLPQPNPYQN